MYKMFFPNSENDHEDKELYYMFTAYLKRALINKRTEYLQANARRKSHEILADIENDIIYCSIKDDKAEKEFERALIWATVMHHMDCLNSRERAVILYSYHLNKTEQEIADIMHRSKSSISYTRKVALAKLKKAIGEED